MSSRFLIFYGEGGTVAADRSVPGTGSGAVFENSLERAALARVPFLDLLQYGSYFPLWGVSPALFGVTAAPGIGLQVNLTSITEVSNGFAAVRNVIAGAQGEQNGEPGGVRARVSLPLARVADLRGYLRI